MTNTVQVIPPIVVDTPPFLLIDNLNPPRIALDGAVALTFSEAIRAGSGVIFLYGDNFTFIEQVTVGSEAVRIEGSTLYYNPIATLKYGAQYSVVIDFGAVVDLAGNPSGYQTAAYFRTALSPVALNETGTDGADLFFGSELADTYAGMGGNDVIHGNGGDDVLDGGDESGDFIGDTLFGGAGNDKLAGGGGMDLLYGGDGDDRLDGGSGNDNLVGDNGDDVLEGGAGFDNLRGGSGSNILRGGDDADVLDAGAEGIDVLDGGAGGDHLLGGVDDSYLGGDGDDYLHIQGGATAGGTVRPDGGNGNDHFYFAFNGGAYTARAVGGAGSDTYFTHAGLAGIDLAITDFKAGDGGDILNLTGVLGNTNYKGGNPFALGYVRMVQDGADALLQVDYDGAAGAGTFATLARLSGVSAASLTAANYHGVDPHGSLAGLTLVGTAEADGLSGGLMNDAISGGAGADYLFGGGGDDLIEGGDEPDSNFGDTIDGGAGNDRVFGGAGRDLIYGGEGNDVLDGGIGNDQIDDNGGDNRLLGGEGNDVLNVNGPGASTLDGGDGDDALIAFGGSHTLLGGLGNDTLSYTAPPESAGLRVHLDGGDGDDRIITDFRGGARVTASGGQGADTYVMMGPANREQDFTISDFNAQQGDMIDLTEVLGELYNGNPFGTAGRMRLVQQGADAVLQHDNDGPEGSAGFVTLVRLANVDAASLGSSSFTGYFNPNGSPVGRIIDGGSGVDLLLGSNLDDTIDGRGGNDDISGRGGNDHLLGGEDNDRLLDNAGNNVLEGGAGNDYIGSSSIGDDLVDGGEGDDFVFGGKGNDTLLGGAGNDRIAVESGTTLTATQVKADGGDGDDQIIFAEGTGTTTITATGGAGVDTFTFERGQHLETIVITDFAGRFGGDKLNVMSAVPWANGRNPFGADGYLRLVQAGSDTLLQIDFDGAAGPGAFRTLATLQNVTASALRASNFSDGLNPDGSSNGLWFSGTSGNDKLVGGMLNDTISGLDGDDTIEGGAGDDRLSGGNGNDSLNGGYGNDELDGGNGNDVLFGGASLGSRTILRGGDGDDLVNLIIFGPSGLAEGGRGNDKLVADGMAMYGATGTGSMFGGEGDDVFVAYLYGQYGVTLSVTGGAGVDTFVVGAVNSNRYTVEDFQAGAGGDLLDVKSLAVSVTPLGNVLDNGVLRFEQQGLDTRVWFDRDGKNGLMYGEEAAMLLKNVKASELGLDNLLRGVLTADDIPVPVVVEPPIVIVDSPPVWVGF